MNGLSEAEIQMNLKTLKKVLLDPLASLLIRNFSQLDPCITAIMSHSSQVITGPLLFVRRLRRYRTQLVFCVKQIVTQVQLYKYVSKNSSDGDWVQTKVHSLELNRQYLEEPSQVAGALFVYQREAAPKYGFMIMNRNSKENMVEMVSPDLTFQVLGK